MLHKLTAFLGLLLAAGVASSQTNYVNANQTVEGTTNYCGLDTGTGNAYVCANAAGATIGAYRIGHHYIFKATHANTAAPTLSVDGLTATTIKKQQAAADLVANDICSGALVDVMYDGTFMQLSSAVCNASTGGSGGGPISINGVSGTSFTLPLQAAAGLGIVNNYDAPSNTTTSMLSTGGRVITSGTTDGITQSDCDTTIVYNDTSNVVTSVGQTPLNIVQGCSFTVVNRNTGTVSLQPVTSLLNGASSYVLNGGASSAPTWITFFADATGNFTIRDSSNGLRGIGAIIGISGGATLSAGATVYFTAPFGCTILNYALTADSGTFTAKFWKVATGTAIPTSTNSINTAGLTLSTGTALRSAVVTDFTTPTISAGDVMALNLTAVSSATTVSAVLGCR